MEPPGRNGPSEHVCVEKRVNETAEVCVLFVETLYFGPFHPL
jgi:hypothetical protein